jgi:hypothetical protein
MNTGHEPSQVESLRALGLRPGATWRQIKRAYRRLALRYHPDHNVRPTTAGDAGDAYCRAMFNLVTRAYAVLERHLRAEHDGHGLHCCARCGELGTMRRGLDGNHYCRTCLLRVEGKRALPGPPVVIVGLGVTSFGLAASAGLLGAWATTGWMPGWWLAVGVCAAALGLMAAICVRVQYAAESQPRRIRATGARRRWIRRLRCG